jgi:uncharacterized protein (DUF2164 family)
MLPQEWLTHKISDRLGNYYQGIELAAAVINAHLHVA